MSQPPDQAPLPASSQIHDQAKTADFLVEHYQKTYELTHELWNDRNRSFPVLAGVIALAAILAAFPDPRSLFNIGLSILFKVSDTQQAALQSALNSIQTDYFYQLLQTALLAVILHLLLDLYRRNQDIARNYLYLAEMEKEIRAALGFGSGRFPFSREDIFYKTHIQSILLKRVRLVYNSALGALLLLYFILRVGHPISFTNQILVLFTIVNILLAVPTIAYFLDYAFPDLFNRSMDHSKPKA